MKIKIALYMMAVLLVINGLAYANQPPVLEEDGPYSIEEGLRLMFSVNGHDSDGDSVAFSATNLPRGAVFEGRTFTWTPDFDQDGTYHVRFTVTDNHGAHDTKTITITVFGVNHAPVIDSVYPYEGRTVEFQEKSARRFYIEAVDPDGDSLHYRWYIDGKRKASSQSFLYDPDYDDSGLHMLEAIVSDGKIEKKVTWNIIITDKNRPPRFTKNVIDLFAEEGKLLKFKANAMDDDDDPITFSANRLPTGAGLDGATGTFTWIPDLNQRGYYEITVKASDTKNGYAWRTFFIRVTNSSYLEELDKSQRDSSSNTNDDIFDNTITFTRKVVSGSGVYHERSTEEQKVVVHSAGYVPQNLETYSSGTAVGEVGSMIEKQNGETDYLKVLAIVSMAVVVLLIIVMAIVKP